MKSFKYALNGLLYVIKTERNMRIHICFAFYVVCAGFVTELNASEWAAVLICTGAVLTLECVNTAIERLCDTLCPEKNEGIRIVKDVSAAAVFCAAISSAAAGLVIFFGADKLEALKAFAGEKPAVLILIVLTLIPAFVFAFRPLRPRGIHK